MKSERIARWFSLIVLVFTVSASNAIAEALYVDSRAGNDANPGTEDQPLQTIGRAAAIINTRTEAGPTTIKIAPGIYGLTECVTFENKRGYTEKARLVIEAVTLPDDPQWKPALMPVILSTEDPRKPDELDSLTATYSITIKISHVTIRGLKFLGNPLARNWHCCISRIGEDVDDLVVTQCLFVGDRDAMDIYCAALATGDRFVADHCIFTNCHACVVFWDGPRGISGRGCAMRYCIVEGAYISGVWTCQTAEDFEFHHNIVTGSEYFWMRRSGDRQKYRLHDCVVANNKYYSGYGVESGPTGQTGPEVTYEQENIIRNGKVVLEKDKRARNYLHVAKDSLGSELGAGLFTK
jgi:hypothetical protein